MKGTKSLNEFAENVCRYVKEALPDELSEAKVRATRLDIWDGNARMVLLVTRPQNGITTGFCLDRHYENYLDGTNTVESAAAAIINDRRLYSFPLDSNSLDNLQGGAVIYA